MPPRTDSPPDLPELPDTAPRHPSWEAGCRALARPAWPLCRLVLLLYLTGPFDRVGDVVAALPDPVETDGPVYEDPGRILAPYLSILEAARMLKDPAAGKAAAPVVREDGSPVDALEGSIARIQQQVLEAELEDINARLCAPCACTLCCVGPGPAAVHDFFEIPLSEDELDRFDLPRVDTPASRAADPYEDPELVVDGRPFHRHPPAIYRWRHGWGLVLGRGARCPHLAPAGRCAVYPDRPDTCRRPQIFPVVLEPADPGRPGTRQVLRETLLAVLDCPYVRRLQDEIAAYGAACGLRVVFRRNKA